jgi:hypothetical protein
MGNIVVDRRGFVIAGGLAFRKRDVFAVSVARMQPEGSESKVAVCQVSLTTPSNRLQQINLRDQSEDPIEQATRTVELYLDVMEALAGIFPENKQALQTQLMNDLGVPVEE